jgi:hypothetical protein
MEKRYVSWWSVGGNITGLILTFATLDLNPVIIVLLVAYATIGIICAWKRWTKAYVFFGSKTYGSALLVLGLFSIQGVYSWLNNVFMSWGVPSLPDVALFLISWLIIAIPVHIIGLVVRWKIDENKKK